MSYFLFCFESHYSFQAGNPRAWVLFFFMHGRKHDLKGNQRMGSLVLRQSLRDIKRNGLPSSSSRSRLRLRVCALRAGGGLLCATRVPGAHLVSTDALIKHSLVGDKQRGYFTE